VAAVAVKGRSPVTRKATSILFAALLFFAFALPVGAESATDTATVHVENDEQAQNPKQTNLPGVSSKSPVYKLPSVGKPRKRIGGGRRGLEGELPKIYTLVPDHVGLTISASPNLYWYLSESAVGRIRFELTLIDHEEIEPVFDIAIDEPSKPGLQKISLAKYGVELDVGREYQWFVALVPNDDHRSEDRVSSGWVERVAEPEGFQAKLMAADANGRCDLFAEEGLWYDMLRASTELVLSHPDEPNYMQQHEMLLNLAGLPASGVK